MEIKLRSALHRAGLRFRKNVRGVFGKPDIVFPRAKVAVFVDGDFWHARILKECGPAALRDSLKTDNREFWMAKLRRNYERDLAVTAELEQLGWSVVRVWENDLKKRMALCLQRVITAVKSREVKRLARGS
jgi:DNA mismatch endonuclease (patch repair protein)